MKISIDALCQIFCKNNEFLILTHMNPDGDAVASSVGLAMILQSMGKKAAVKCCDAFPEKFDFLISNYHNDELISPVLVGVDIAAKERLGTLSEMDVTVCIDHHASNLCLIESTYLESGAVSCSLILYKIFRYMQFNIPQNALALLFAGIITDSVCFQSVSTNAEAFAVAGEIAKIIEVHSIIQRIFVSKSKAELEVEQSMLASFTYYLNNQLVIGLLRNDKIELIGKKNASGYASMVLKPAGTRVGVAILEKEPEKYSVSFKSSEFDMAKLARRFGGGGHTEAAGAIVKEAKLDSLIRNIVNEVATLF